MGTLELSHNLIDFTGNCIAIPFIEYTGSVQYIPRMDEIQYTDYTKKQVSPSEFLDILNATLNAEDLPLYLQSVIDHWKKEQDGFQLIDDSLQKEYAAYSVENIQGKIFLRRNYNSKK